jgi:hypothetical protein
MPQLLHAALECADFTVDIAGTCNDAREALSLVPHDAAVLDLGLPDGDGMPSRRTAPRWQPDAYPSQTTSASVARLTGPEPTHRIADRVDAAAPLSKSRMVVCPVRPASASS